MRITVFFSMLLLAGALLAGCNQAESSAPSVAVVDTARVFRDSDAGKAGVKFLEGMHEKMQAELNGIQESLAKNPNDQAAQQKLQETYMDFQQRMGAEQQNVLTQLNDVAQRAMDNYRTQNKLQVILGSEAALSFDKAVDVTTGVIAEMNKQKVEFKATQPEAAKPAAPEAAPADMPAAKATDKAADKNGKPAPTQNATKPADKK